MQAKAPAPHEKKLSSGHAFVKVLHDPIAFTGCILEILAIQDLHGAAAPRRPTPARR